MNPLMFLQMLFARKRRRRKADDVKVVCPVCRKTQYHPSEPRTARCNYCHAQIAVGGTNDRG